MKSFEEEITPEIGILGVDIRDIFSLTLNQKPVEVRLGQLAEGLENSESNRREKEYQLYETDKELIQQQGKLDEPNRKYQQYIYEMNDWEKRRKEIMGDVKAINSLEYFRKQLDDLETIPGKLETFYNNRNEVLTAIYKRVQVLVNSYSEFYGPVQKFINDHPLASSKLLLNFDVSIVNTGFFDRFFEWVGKNTAGSFYSAQTGEKMLRDILEKYTYNDLESVFNFIGDIFEHLKYDKRVLRKSPNVD